MSKMNKYDRAHLVNLQGYQRKIDKLYQSLLREAALLGASVGKIKGDTLFSFADYPTISKRAERLFSTLKEGVYSVIVNGIDAEWTLANNKNNELAQRVFGDNVGKLSQAQYRRYFSTNNVARDAFIARKEQGLNLSDRVWKYTDQFKTEIELGLDIGIRNGQSAADLARDLKQYLQQPDRLFRRVRDEHGNLQLSKAAQSYHPGQGVYRSSYKNARRLAATETNIAYRTADYERWQQLDFVVGIEIKLSNNHTTTDSRGQIVPLTDICDELAGRYPKDFKFTGWHPHCRCHALTILKTEKEMEEDTRRILNGEPLDGESVNKVDDVPAQFKEWLNENAERIKNAKHLPYFLADNEKYTTTAMSVAERAATRHAARTPEQIEAIRHNWYERKAIRHYGNSILSYMGGISDVDTSALANALRGGDMQSILTEARKLKATGKQILALNRLANPMQVAREFSMTDAIAVNTAVENKLAQWANLPLEKQKSKLLFEIDWVEKNKKYPTWRHAQQAYKKQLVNVQDAIDWKSIGSEFKSASGFKTKSKPYHDLLAKLQDAISDKDKTVAQQTILDINNKRAQLEKTAAQRIKAKGKANFDADAYSQKRKDAAIWAKTREDADNAFRENTEKVWKSATHDEKVAATSYTSGSGGINRPLRGYDGSWHDFKGVGKVSLNNEGREQHIKDLTSLINRSVSTKDVWVQRGIESTDGIVNFLGMSQREFGNITSQADADKLIGKICTDNAFVSCGSAKGTGFSGYILNIYCPKGTKMLYAEPFSYFNGDSCSIYSLWDGVGKYDLNSELETIIQRGTQFRIIKAEYTKYGRLYLNVEVIAQI